MSRSLPKLGPDAALEILDEHLSLSLEELGDRLPIEPPTKALAPIAGPEFLPEDFEMLRNELLVLAHGHGMPSARSNLSGFDGNAALIIRDLVDLSLYEASQDDGWAYLTCCWLLDIAIWRFGEKADKRRFLGDLNRNVYRRLWWRAEILGDVVDLTQFGEDELVNIMERPTLFEDRRLAQSIAQCFLDFVKAHPDVERMFLMRDATKRILRLTPFVAFPTLSTEAIDAIVHEAFDAALAGIQRQGHGSLSATGQGQGSR